ncbi:MAG: exodeoxyribonuclease III [bacterium]
MPFTVVTWNVNSLRSALRQGFCDWLKEMAPDVVCLQEVRATLDQLRPLESLFDGYRVVWNPATRPGYAGTAILTRFEPVAIETGLNGDSDPEGRALTIDFGAFKIASLYAPNATPLTPKMPVKCEWLSQLRTHIEAHSDKLFIVAGDLNVAHGRLDSRDELYPQSINGCSDEERLGFQNVVAGCDLIDPHREQAGEAILSSWWHIGSPERFPDTGIRFDYVLIGAKHREAIVSGAIHPDIFGSDHCPVSLELDFSTEGLRRVTSVGQSSLL